MENANRNNRSEVLHRTPAKKSNVNDSPPLDPKSVLRDALRSALFRLECDGERLERRHVGRCDRSRVGRICQRRDA